MKPGRGTNENAKMIIIFFQQHDDEVKSSIGKDFSSATLERYKTSYDHTKSFMEWKYGVADMDIHTADFIGYPSYRSYRKLLSYY